MRGIVTDVPPQLHGFVLLLIAYDVFWRRDGRQGRGPCMFTTSRGRKVWCCRGTLGGLPLGCFGVRRSV